MTAVVSEQWSVISGETGYSEGFSTEKCISSSCKPLYEPYSLLMLLFHRSLIQVLLLPCDAFSRLLKHTSSF